MKEVVKKVCNYFSLYGITIFVGIIGTLCLIYFAEKFYCQLDVIFNKYNLKFYLILALCFIWLFFYVVYLHKQFVEFVKFVVSDNLSIRKDISKLNRETRNLIILHTKSKEDEVA